MSKKRRVKIGFTLSANRKGVRGATAASRGITVSAPNECSARHLLNDRLRHERRKLFK